MTVRDPKHPARSLKGKVSVADRVYEALKNDIFEFRLIPGDRFSETDVARRLEASRTPVREALYRLQREGYVEVLFRAGWRVCPFDFETFEELYDLRITLEQAAVHKLCWREEAQSVITRLQAVWDPDRSPDRVVGSTVRLLDEHFHCELVSAAGNREMARIHQQLTERLRIIRRLDFTQRNRIRATYEEHSEILDALTRRRAEDAARMLSAHIRTSQAAVREITMERIEEAAHRHRQRAMSPV